MTATLEDNPSARDFASLLRKLSEEASGPFDGEAAGDLCYYAPWGNLAMFHAGYEYSNGLIRLGRFDGRYEPLLTRGKFSLHIRPSAASRL
jgi:hypothetical protein